MPHPRAPHLHGKALDCKATATHPEVQGAEGLGSTSSCTATSSCTSTSSPSTPPSASSTCTPPSASSTHSSPSLFPSLFQPQQKQEEEDGEGEGGEGERGGGGGGEEVGHSGDGRHLSCGDQQILSVRARLVSRAVDVATALHVTRALTRRLDGLGALSLATFHAHLEDIIKPILDLSAHQPHGVTTAVLVQEAIEECRRAYPGECACGVLCRSVCVVSCAGGPIRVRPVAPLFCGSVLRAPSFAPISCACFRSICCSLSHHSPAILMARRIPHPLFTCAEKMC